MGPFSNLPFDQIPTRFGFNASAPSIDVTPFEARDKGQFMFGGSSTLTVNLEATSFPRGEVIVVNTRVNNDAKKELVKVKARLRRHALLRAGAAEKAFSEEVKEAFLDGTKETGAVAERTFTFDTKSLQPCVRFTTPKCLKVWYSLLIKAEYSFATDPEVNVLLNILETRSRRDDLEDAFRTFDADGSGYISRAEFKKASQKLSDQELDQCRREADQDGNGQISFEELVQDYYKTIAANR